MRIKVEFTKNEKEAFKSICKKTAAIMEVEEIISHEEAENELAKINEVMDSQFKDCTSIVGYEVDGRKDQLTMNAIVSENFVVKFLEGCRKFVGPVIAMSKAIEKYIVAAKEFIADMEEAEPDMISFGRSENTDVIYVGKGFDPYMLAYVDLSKYNHVYLANEEDYDEVVVNYFKNSSVESHFGYENMQAAWDAYFDNKVAE